MSLTTAQHDQLKSMGIDWQHIDWAKIISILQLIISLFGQPDPKPVLKAAGCSDDLIDQCCRCCEAGQLSLQSAQISFECCGGMCAKK